MGATDPNERLRREAAEWFARMRGPDAARHQAAFEAWRATPEHRETYARLTDRFDESAILADSRLAGLRPSARHRPQGPSVVVKLALAACLVAAVGLGALRLAKPAPPAAAGQLYATRVGEIRTIALADGATLTLDTDSAAAALEQDGRLLVRLQRGRARLAAPGNAPLALEAGDARLLARAATLDLDLGPERQVVVTVLSGAPELASRPGPWRRVRYQPLAADHVRISRGERPRVLQPDAAEAGWPQGLRTFQKTPLAAVAAIANRYDRRKIVFDDPGIGRLEVSGVFKVTQTDRLAQALAKAFGLTVRTAPGGDFILSRQAA